MTNAMRYSAEVSIDETIGRNVHQLMWDKRIQHRPIYEAMGLSRQSLQKKMRGEVAWLARDIEAAAKVLDVQPGELFGSLTRRSLSAVAARVRALDLGLAA